MSANQGKIRGFGAIRAALQAYLRQKRRLIPVLAGLALLGLAGCAMDREAAVRAQLGNWVILADTTFFRSTLHCTAGVFSVSSDAIRNSIQRVQSVNRGLRLIRQDIAVAFVVEGMLPADIHAELNEAYRWVGLSMLMSSLAAKDCFPPKLVVAFSDALHSIDVVLMYDPANAAVALFEPANNRIFYARGKIFYTRGQM